MLVQHTAFSVNFKLYLNYCLCLPTHIISLFVWPLRLLWHNKAAQFQSHCICGLLKDAGSDGQVTCWDRWVTNPAGWQRLRGGAAAQNRTTHRPAGWKCHVLPWTADCNKKKKEEWSPAPRVAKHAGVCKQSGTPCKGREILAAEGNPRKQHGWQTSISTAPCSSCCSPSSIYLSLVSVYYQKQDLKTNNVTYQRQNRSNLLNNSCMIG